MYKIKEIYYTLQGEGQQAGRAAIFCRFTGCNLWSGREEDRNTAICQFCDTDFVGVDGLNGGKYTAVDLSEEIKRIWNENVQSAGLPYVVFTGGEPLLQLDETLVNAMKNVDFEVAIETNGTIELPCKLDWVCVSPKPNTEILLKTGDELKFVYPQKEIGPMDFEHYNFSYYFLQPMDDANQKRNIQKTVQYCLDHPKWRLSLQMHKVVEIA